MSSTPYYSDMDASNHRPLIVPAEEFVFDGVAGYGHFSKIGSLLGTLNNRLALELYPQQGP